MLENLNIPLVETQRLMGLGHVQLAMLIAKFRDNDYGELDDNSDCIKESMNTMNDYFRIVTDSLRQGELDKYKIKESISFIIIYLTDIESRLLNGNDEYDLYLEFTKIHHAVDMALTKLQKEL